MLAHLFWAVPTPRVHRPLRFSIVEGARATAAATAKGKVVAACEVPCCGAGGVRAGDAALAGVLRAVPAKHLVGLVGALLAEARVVLVATDRARLAPAAAALRALLAPLQWTGLCVPVLPRRLLALLAAPAPCLLGCTRATLAAALRRGLFASSSPSPASPPPPPLVYDLDNTAPVLLAASASSASSSSSVPPLPEDVLATLLADLARVHGRGSAQSDALDWDPWRAAAQHPSASPAALARGGRTAFLRATARVLAGARRHVLHLRTEPAPRALFNVEAAVDAHAPRDRAFYAALYRTSHFAHYCRALVCGCSDGDSARTPGARLAAAAQHTRLWDMPFDDAVRRVDALLDRCTAPPIVLPSCVLPSAAAGAAAPATQPTTSGESTEGLLEQLDWARVEDAAQQYARSTTSSDGDGDDDCCSDDNSSSNNNGDDDEEEEDSTETPAVAYTEEERRLAHWFVALLADDRHTATAAADVALLQQVAALVRTRAGRKALLAEHGAYRAAAGARAAVVLSPQYFALLADVVRSALDAAFRARDFLTAVGLCALAEDYSKLAPQEKQQQEERLRVSDTLATLDVWNSALFWEARTVLAVDAALRAHYGGDARAAAARHAALDRTRAAAVAAAEAALVGDVAARTCAAMLASGVSDAAAARWVRDVAALADLDVAAQRALRARITARAPRTPFTRDAPDATRFESLTGDYDECGLAAADADAEPTLLVPVCGERGGGSGGSGRAWRMLLHSVLTAAPREVPLIAQQLARALAPPAPSAGGIARVHTAHYTRAHIVEKLCCYAPAPASSSAIRGGGGSSSNSGSNNRPSPVLSLAAFAGHVACGRADGAVVLWRTAACGRGAAAAAAGAHAGAVGALAHCAAADALVSGAADRTAVVWAAARLEKVRTLRAHAAAVRCVCAAARAPLVLTGAADGTCAVWDVRARAPAHALRGHTRALTAAALCADTLVLTGARDGRVLFWDLRAPAAPVVCAAHRDWVSAVLFAGGAATSDNSGNNNSNGGAAYTPMSAALDGELIAWDVQRGVPARRLAAHTGAVTALRAAAGAAVATAGADATLRVWDRGALHQRRCLVGHAGAVTALLPFRGTLVTGGADATLRVWDPSTASALPPCRAVLAAHTAPVAALCPVADYAFASASWDGSVRLWEIDYDF